MRGVPSPASASSPLVVELTSPQSVDGRRAAFQSLWLLVRMRHAHDSQTPMVRLADLRGEVSDASTLRMVVSRAFRDFKAWGIEVGWGEDSTREPRFLNAERRSQGPFWLPPAEARRVRCEVEGAPPARPRSPRSSACAHARAPRPALRRRPKRCTCRTRPSGSSSCPRSGPRARAG